MGSGPSLEVTGKTAADPATQRRQEHLWQNAERFAAGQPFQQEYGYGSQMVPGLTGMQQTGQQYLTDKILGKGAYGYQSLGFQDYRRPLGAPQSNFQYSQSGYAPGQYFQPGYQAGRLRTGAPPEGGDASMAWGGGVYTAGDGIGRDEGDGGGDLTDEELEALGLFDIDEITGETRYIQPGEWARRAQYGTTPYEPDGYTVATPDEITPTTSLSGLDERHIAQPGQGGTDWMGPWDPWGVGYTEGLNPAIDQNIWNVEGRSKHGPHYNQPAFGLQNVPDATSAAAYAARGGDPTALGYTPSTGGGLLQTDLSRPTAGVGIGEIEDARTATRRMLLEQGRTGDPAYNQFLPAQAAVGEPGDADYVPAVDAGWHGIAGAQGVNTFLPGAPAAGATAGVDPGWLEQTTAGTGTAPTAAQTAIDALTPWERRDPETGDVTEIGYQPGFDEVGAGDVLGAATDSKRYTDPTTDPLYKGWTDKQLGLTERDSITDILGRTDPTTGKPITGKAFREGWGIKDPTIGTAVWNEDDAPWKGLETVAQTGDADWLDVSKVKTPTLTDAEVIGATEVGEAGADGGGIITPDAVKTAAGAGFDTISAPTDVTIDPLYKGWTEAELGTAETSAITDATRLGAGGQDVFTGSSFLGGPAGFTPQTVTETDAEGNVTTRQTTPIEAYMDAGGVGAQVTAAQLDYARAQNEEQARRAQSLAWGTRGDIPRAEQETAMLARIAEIRRKGYTDAADRMEADLQRQQAAGMQTQQLGTQGALQAQQLEAQRVGDRAARAQQAALAQQQLGAQAGMQTQQLKQQGGIRGAELGMQAGLQAQQLEAQRLEANAARVQQAALAGQELGGRYGLQTQQLGQQAAMRNAEMDMQAALANQQAALQTGTQSQQLEAQRQIEQARLKLAGQQQTQQLGVQTGLAAQSLEAQRAEAQAARAQQAALAQYQAGIEGGMQTQRLGVGADQRQAELDMQAALANQQAALQTGSQAAQLEAGRRAQQAQLDLQRLQQTQQLGASAAAQQAALESTRRRGLAGFGQEAAQQQVQNEFARRQGLAQMGLQAQGMGMDDQARFRQQQMQAAQQLAGIGGMEQAATFGAAGQLGAMGQAQQQARQQQAIADYEQWLRGQEGGAEELAMLQAMQPMAQMQQYQRKPSMFGQIAGGLLGAAGTVGSFMNPVG